MKTISKRSIESFEKEFNIDLNSGGVHYFILKLLFRNRWAVGDYYLCKYKFHIYFVFDV